MKGSAGRPARALSYALGAAILWPVVERVAAPTIESYGLYGVVWVRYAAQLLLLLMIGLVLVRPVSRLVTTRRPALQLLRGVAMFAMPVLYVMAVREGGIGWAGAVLWCAPVLAVVGADVLGVSRYRRLTLVPMFMCIGAVGLLLRPGFGGGRSLALAGLSALALGGYMVLSRVLRHERIETSLFYTSVGSLTAITLFFGGGVGSIDMILLPYVLLLGTTGLGFLFCLDRALEHGSVALVAPVLFLVPLLENLIRFAGDGAFPARLTLLPAILIPLGVLAAIASESSGQRAPE